MVPVVDDSVVPLKVTDHDDPEGSPDSVNVTLYFVVCVFPVFGIFVDDKFILIFTFVFCSCNETSMPESVPI